MSDEGLGDAADALDAIRQRRRWRCPRGVPAALVERFDREPGAEYGRRHYMSRADLACGAQKRIALLHRHRRWAPRRVPHGDRSPCGDGGAAPSHRVHHPGLEQRRSPEEPRSPVRGRGELRSRRHSTSIRSLFVTASSRPASVRSAGSTRRSKGGWRRRRSSREPRMKHVARPPRWPRRSPRGGAVPCWRTG